MDLPRNKDFFFTKTKNDFCEFSQSFKFRIAATQEDRHRVYNLRHKVFCQELKGDMPQDRKRELEYDHYDSRSIHCFIEHVRTGLVAGCLRLIIPRNEDPTALQRLSLEDLVPADSYTSKLNPYTTPRDNLCEISRLAISPAFRQKNTGKSIEKTETCNGFSEAETQHFSYLITGLFLSAYALIGLTKRRHIYAFMEKRLTRLLSRSGFYFEGISKIIHFHGKRQVFYLDQHRIEKEMHESLIPLYNHIWQELAPQLGSALQEATLQANANPSLSFLNEAPI